MSGDGPAPPAQLAHLEPTRMHWVSVVRDVPVRQLLQNLLAPAVAAFSALGPGNGLRAMLVVLLVFLLFRVAAWQRRTLSLVDGVLTDRSGVLTRNERTMAVARLQQLEVERGPLDRLLGIAHVRMEAAADAGSTEIDLRAVPLDLAQRLATLRSPTARGGNVAGSASPASSAWRSDDGAEATVRDAPRANDGDSHEGGVADPPAGAAAGGTGRSGTPGVLAAASGLGTPPGTLVYAPGLGRVALSAATGRRLAALPIAVGLAFQLVDELGIDPSDYLDGSLRPTTGSLVAVVVGGLLVGLLLAIAAAVVLGLLRDGNVEVRRDGDVLRVRRGLLTIRSATIPMRRVQLVRVRANPVRRWLGFASVEVQTSANPFDGSGAGAERRLALPHVPLDDVEALLAEVVPAAAVLPPMRAHPERARGRLVRRTVLGLLASVGLGGPLLVLVGRPVAGAVLWAVLVVVGVLLGRRAFARLALGQDTRMVATRSGLFGLREDRVPVPRVQSAWLTSQPFQRRVDLVSLRVASAGTGTALEAVDVDPADAEATVRALTAMAPTPSTGASGSGA